MGIASDSSLSKGDSSSAVVIVGLAYIPNDITTTKYLAKDVLPGALPTGRNSIQLLSNVVPFFSSNAKQKY